MNASQAPFSPVALVGTIALLAAYALAGWCVAAGIAGNARKNRRLVTSSVYGLYGFGALIGLASALMIYAFVTHDFTIKYVAATPDERRCRSPTRSPRSGAASMARSCSGCSCCRCSRSVAISVNRKRHRDMIRVRRRDDHGRPGVLPVAAHLHEEPVQHVPHDASGRRQGPQSAPTELLDGRSIRRRSTPALSPTTIPFAFGIGGARVGPPRRHRGSARCAYGC